MRAAAFAGLAAFAIGTSLTHSIPPAEAQSPEQMCQAIIDAHQRQFCLATIKPKQALPVPLRPDQAAEGLGKVPAATQQDSVDCDSHDPERQIHGCTQIINDPSAAQLIHANAFNNRGNAYNSKGEYQRAIADFTEAIRLNSKLAYIYVNRSFALFKTGASERAIADLNEAIRIEPTDSKAYHQRALTYRALGDVERANADERVAERMGQAPLQSSISGVNSALDPKHAADVAADQLKDCVTAAAKNSKHNLFEIVKGNCSGRWEVFLQACTTFFFGHSNVKDSCIANGMSLTQLAINEVTAKTPVSTTSDELARCVNLQARYGKYSSFDDGQSVEKILERECGRELVAFVNACTQSGKPKETCTLGAAISAQLAIKNFGK
jgi:tetratricopeptide (TPR) repeat protein